MQLALLLHLLRQSLLRLPLLPLLQLRSAGWLLDLDRSHTCLLLLLLLLWICSRRVAAPLPQFSHGPTG
jgi:hypothetical protein